MTHILWLVFKNNLSILDEEEIKDILGEYYVGINSHRRAPAGGAIAPRPGWRHFTIMTHNLWVIGFKNDYILPPADIIYFTDLILPETALF